MRWPLKSVADLHKWHLSKTIHLTLGQSEEPLAPENVNTHAKCVSGKGER